MISTVRYSLDVIQDEVAYMVQQGVVSRHQPIYCLCRCFPIQEWSYIEAELEQHDYLLRDRIGDLLSQEVWHED
ncbi:MAG TPA: DUF4327 family protein [Microcoleaceae cyanobacterium]|jgi:hypothetical protein